MLLKSLISFNRDQLIGIAFLPLTLDTGRIFQNYGVVYYLRNIIK